MVNVAADCIHPAQAAPKADPASLFSDKLGKPVHKENADEFSNQINEIVELEHGLMLALSGPNVKAGKRGYRAMEAK